MKELYENLEKQRPNLFTLASDTEENGNNGITEILEANDTSDDFVQAPSGS